MSHWPLHARIEGAIVMIGFGSIGKGTLPLIERHFEFDKEHFVVIDPDDSDRRLLDDRSNPVLGRRADVADDEAGRRPPREIDGRAVDRDQVRLASMASEPGAGETSCM